VDRIASAASDTASQDARRLVEIDVRLRAAEMAGTRSEERFVSLQADVRRLIGIVERIERNGNGTYPNQQ
jgi:hypothetical protein